MEAEKLVGVHRNYFGDIISFQTSTGRVISYRKALQEVDMGMIEGVNIEEQHDGTLQFTSSAEDDFDHFPSIF